MSLHILTGASGTIGQEILRGLLRAKKPTLAIVKTEKSKTLLDQCFASEAEDHLLFTRSLNLTKDDSLVSFCKLVDEIDFKMSSGNIDAGEIRMYGVATS